MARYSIDSMKNAADNIGKRIVDAKEQLAKMESLATKAEAAIQGGQAGEKLAQKIKSKKKEMLELLTKIEGIVPVINSTITSLDENNQNIVTMIDSL